MSENGRRQTEPLWTYTYLSTGRQPIIGLSRVILVSLKGLDGLGRALVGWFDAVEAGLHGASRLVCGLLRGRHYSWRGGWEGGGFKGHQAYYTLYREICCRHWAIGWRRHSVGSSPNSWLPKGNLRRRERRGIDCLGWKLSMKDERIASRPTTTALPWRLTVRSATCPISKRNSNSAGTNQSSPCGKETYR